MLNFKNKKVLSALLSLSLAFEPIALAQNNPITNEEIQEDHRIGIPYGNGNDEYINANGHRNFNLPKEIAKDIKVYY